VSGDGEGGQACQHAAEFDSQGRFDKVGFWFLVYGFFCGSNILFRL